MKREKGAAGASGTGQALTAGPERWGRRLCSGRHLCTPGPPSARGPILPAGRERSPGPAKLHTCRRPGCSQLRLLSRSSPWVITRLGGLCGRWAGVAGPAPTARQLQTAPLSSASAPRGRVWPDCPRRGPPGDHQKANWDREGSYSITSQKAGKLPPVLKPAGHWNTLPRPSRCRTSTAPHSNTVPLLCLLPTPILPLRLQRPT